MRGVERNLILASASPRRREILQNAGIVFSVRPAPVEERRGETEPPLAYVKRLAEEKARAACQDPREFVLGADTTVALGDDDQVLEKPRDLEDARRMIGLLQGRAHHVITGVCLLHQGLALTDAEVTRVWFAPLDAAEISQYIASGEPADKAGGYGIQGLASKFVTRIEGCYFNVMGLPIALVYRMLKAGSPLA
jgi:septum formation protein